MCLMHVSLFFTASQKWYFVNKIVLTYCEKICSSDREKSLKFETEGQEFANFLGVTRTVYTNSERSEQFWVTKCFFNYIVPEGFSYLID